MQPPTNNGLAKYEAGQAAKIDKLQKVHQQCLLNVLRTLTAATEDPAGGAAPQPAGPEPKNGSELLPQLFAYVASQYAKILQERK